MCVVVRDLIVFGVLADMMRGRAGGLRDLLQLRRGRPPLRLERADTLEALRKLDEQFARIDTRRARYAPRPYELVVLSDHGQTQGATFSSATATGSTSS